MTGNTLVRGRLPAALAVLALAELAVEPLRALRDVPDTDYVAFATGARLLHGARCLYCEAAQYAAQRDLLGHLSPAAFKRFVNPPPAALLLEPLDRLPLAAGLGVFLVVLTAALAGAAVLFARLAGAGTLRERLVPAVLALASAPAAWGVALGQWDPLVVLAELGAIALAERRRPVASGLLASVGLVKPQLVFLLPVALLAARSWRMLAGLTLGGIAWAAGSLLLAGREITDVATLVRADAGAAGHPAVVSALLVLAALVALGAGRELLYRDIALAVAAGCGLSLLCSPHLNSDDFIMLTLPILVVARWRPAAAAIAGLSITGAYMVDQALSLRTAQLEVAACLLVVGAAFLVARHAAGRHEGAGGLVRVA